MSLLRRSLLVRNGALRRQGLLVGGALVTEGGGVPPVEPPDPEEEVPTITAPGPEDTPDVEEDMLAETAEFIFPDQSAVTRTTWTLKNALTGAIAFESRRDTVHLFAITIPADTMVVATAYTLYVHFFGKGRLVTRRASVTFTTAA